MTTTGTRCGAAILGLLAGTLGGCAHQEGKTAGGGAKPTAAQQSQQTAQTAAQQAAQADQQLAQARQQLEAAHQAAIQAEQQRGQARQQLAQADQRATDAQQRIGLEQANVQRLDQAARLAHAQATDAAMQAQVAAEEAQGLRSATGWITQATPSRVILQVQGGQAMAFDIDGRTRVLVGTEQRSVADLQQGAEARVAYDPSGAEPAAVAIHVTPARGRPPAAQQQPPPQQR